jgi:ribosomal-protein-alanine N-acetyltransferase
MPFDPPAELRTARLVLRPPVASDAAAIFAAYARDPQVTRFLTWRPHRDVHDSHDYVTEAIAAWDGAQRRVYMLTLDDAGAVGALELRNGPHGVSVGYVLARSWWGRGLMTEAVSAAVAWSLAQPEIWRVWSFCDVANLASARVMEKAGLGFEAILQRWIVHPNLSAEPRDCRLHAQVR